MSKLLVPARTSMRVAGGHGFPAELIGSKSPQAMPAGGF